MISRIPGPDKTGLAFLGLLTAFSVVFILAISSIDFIGIGDSPIYANIAQHMVERTAYESDYVQTFFTQYDDLPHFEDNWFPLPSFTIAISYLLFGVSLFSAQLTNYWVVLLILISLYFAGSKLLGREAALLAGALYLSNVLVWENILMPMSEAAFGLVVLVFGLSMLMHKKTGEKKWLALMLASGFLVGTARASAIAFVPIALLWGIYVYRNEAKALFARLWVLAKGKKQSAKNGFPAVLVALAALSVFAGYAILPSFVFLEYGSFTHQPEKNTIFRVGVDEKGTYNDIFSVYYGDDYAAQALTLENNLTAFRVASLEYGRFLRDVLTQNVFSTLIVIFFALGLFSQRFWTRETARLTLSGLLVFSLMVIFLGHYEQRYTIIFAPLMSLVATSSVLEQFGKLKKSLDRALFVSIISLFLLITFLSTYSLMVLPDRFFAKDGGTIETALESFEWVDKNTPKDSVIFSRHPATVGYHSNRKAVMLPNEDWDTILLVAAYYNADYFWFANWDFSSGNPRFSGIYDGNAPGFLEPVYDSHPGPGKGPEERARVFRINWEKTGFEGIEKPEWFMGKNGG